jgi:hypothetical protein
MTDTERFAKYFDEYYNTHNRPGQYCKSVSINSFTVLYKTNEKNYKKALTLFEHFFLFLFLAYYEFT